MKYVTVFAQHALHISVRLFLKIVMFHIRSNIHKNFQFLTLWFMQNGATLLVVTT